VGARLWITYVYMYTYMRVKYFNILYIPELYISKRLILAGGN
jgi:hypothetical protein